MNGAPAIIKTGTTVLDLTRPAVMAIINVTPDSFWEGSRNGTDKNSIAASADRAVREGAAILDVGGYSSRPGADDVSPREETARLCRAMDIIRERHPDITVSLDTFRAEVARTVIDRYGPCVVNDISAGELDPEMIPAVASLGVPYIAMHMRGTPRDMQEHTGYDNIVDQVRSYLGERARRLAESGVKQVIVDPGFGFAKTTRQNYELLCGLDRICSLSYPVLTGVSRKSMIYKLLGKTPADALAGSVALNWECLRKGASIIRVHDVREAVDTVRLFEYYTGTAG